MFGIMWWIIVGLVAGWATGKVMGGEKHGALMDIAIGIAGALVGGFLMHLLGFSAEGGLIYTILVAIGGAGGYRFVFNSTASTKLKNWLGWQVTLGDNYISNPPFGIKGNDLLLSTGLRLTFGGITQ